MAYLHCEQRGFQPHFEDTKRLRSSVEPTPAGHFKEASQSTSQVSRTYFDAAITLESPSSAEMMEDFTGRRGPHWLASSRASERRHRFPLSLFQRISLLLVLISSLIGTTYARDEKPEDNPDGITTKIVTFDAQHFIGFYYLERTEQDDTDETIVMQDQMRNVWITHDHGKTWGIPPLLEDDNAWIVATYPHPYKKDRIFFVTGSNTVYYTLDRGRHIKKLEAKNPPSPFASEIMNFHPNQEDWFIWTGAEQCDDEDSIDECHSESWFTPDRGKSWTFLRRYVKKCQFITEAGRGDNENLIYCEQYENEDMASPGATQLVASDDFFKETREVHFKDIIDFATMSEFIIVAAKDEDQKSLKVDASVDGWNFAEAKFPPDFQVQHQQAYTVLDSSTHSVFLHVTVNARPFFEYGTIIKSNSNGTSYVVSHRAVNRNEVGYVDFEKMQGLEGVAMINIVANPREALLGQKKILKTKITHNDGADWSLIEAPATGADGKPINCEPKDKERCSLHLHAYTERDDPRETFSSPSAVGLMMAVGNVGDHLGTRQEGDTYITRDGGIVWHAVKNGTYLWEYGDQGSIIVIVEKSTPTREVFFTLDEGRKWERYEFSEDLMSIDEITTVPSDNSREFLLWGRVTSNKSIATVNLDFSGLPGRSRKCRLEDEEGGESDYETWEPKHPEQEDNCLFGHVTQYHRKKIDADCYNGVQLKSKPVIKSNCPCTRKDFECDWNFERQPGGTCKAVGTPKDYSQACRDDPKLVEYHKPTGYRRIPITTCKGGMEFDLSSDLQECEGHHEEFKKKHGISGAGLFFAITVPFLLSAAIGWWAYHNCDGKFGRIRLGDSAQATFSSGSPLITYPVAVISAIVAILATLPLLVSSLWRSASSRLGGGSSVRYTTRSSLSRGRSDYAVVAENYSEDGELLGDDSDEEPTPGTV
ncbi:MAG: vacuolar protein sorting/targeting protein PEP1 [Geoglossum simile]|nr:MAG: vacuolar protein sorting/targeting protein PEP1 [Geoglossum simile]